MIIGVTNALIDAVEEELNQSRYIQGNYDLEAFFQLEVDAE